MDESGYLVPDAHDEVFGNNGMSNGYISDGDADEHHYEPLEPAKDTRKKGRSWRIFGTARRRSKSLGPTVGRLFRRSTISSELDFEKHWKLSRTETMKQKVNDVVSVGHEVGSLDEKQLWRYKNRKMSTPSFASTPFNNSHGSGFNSPLDRIPSIGSLAAATLPPVPDRQPALPPRRYSVSSTFHSRRSMDDGSIPPRSPNESLEDPAAMDDELQILRYRVEVLERRLAGELDNEDFKVLIDDRGESSTDDSIKPPEVPMPPVMPSIPSASDAVTYAKPHRRGNLQRRAMSSGDITVASIAPRLSTRRRSRHSDWVSRHESFKAHQRIGADGVPSHSAINSTLNSTEDIVQSSDSTMKPRLYSRSISSTSDNVFVGDTCSGTSGHVGQVQSINDDDVHVQSSSTWYSRNFGLVKRENSSGAPVESGLSEDPVFSENQTKGVSFQDSYYDESKPVNSLEPFDAAAFSEYQGPILTSHGVLDGTTSAELLCPGDSGTDDFAIKDVDFNTGLPPPFEDSWPSKSTYYSESDLSKVTIYISYISLDHY